MTTKPHEVAGIQILRGVAAIAVVIHHTLEVSNGSKRPFSPDWLTTSGAVGVDIFFVISGFIMMYTSFAPGREPIRPLAFLRKRALRIYPFYWVCLLAMSALFAIGFMRSHEINLYKFLSSTLLIPGDPVIGISWTLSYEVFFYLIFGAALLSRSREITGLISVSAIALAIGTGALFGVPFLADPIIIEFCFGVLLALVARNVPDSRMVIAIGALAWATALLAPAWIRHDSTSGLEGWSRVACWGISSLLIVAASLHIPAPQRWFGRTLLFLGDASYATYLTHIFVMIAYGWVIKTTFIGGLHQVPVVVIITLLCILVSSLAHIWVERPMNRILKGQRAFEKRTPASAAINLSNLRYSETRSRFAVRDSSRRSSLLSPD